MLGLLILFYKALCTCETHPTTFNAAYFVKRSLVYLVEGNV